MPCSSVPFSSSCCFSFATCCSASPFSCARASRSSTMPCSSVPFSSSCCVSSLTDCCASCISLDCASRSARSTARRASNSSWRVLNLSSSPPRELCIERKSNLQHIVKSVVEYHNMHQELWPQIKGNKN